MDETTPLFGREDNHPIEVLLPEDVEALLEAGNTNAPLPEVESAVYPRRFFELAVLCFVAIEQCAIWMTFSPVQDQATMLFGFDKTQVALFTLWGPISYLLVGPVIPWILQRISIRAGVTLAAFLCAVATGLRCITRASPWALVLTHISCMINGAAAPFVLSTVTRLSATWFRPENRTLTTSIGIMASYVGGGVGFLISKPIHTAADLLRLLYWEAAFASFLLFVAYCGHVYWPSPVPPKPPSLSALVVRSSEIMLDYKAMFNNKPFMLLAVASGVAQGTYNAWSGVLFPILKPLHFSQGDAAMLGLTSIISSTAGGIVFGWAVDRLQAYRPVLMSLLLAAAAVIAWFVLVANGIIPGGLKQVYIAVNVGSFLLNAGAGVFFEALAECSFPIDEVSSSNILNIIFNTSGAIYALVTAFVPEHYMGILNWLLFGSIIFALSCLVFYRDERRRSRIDELAA
eukprot:m.310531 g.310531  ORF g.310531 m.310531 type:complete len:459 (+) comp25451_c0_seq1:3-1379(+)